MKAISLRKAIAVFGGTNVSLQKGYHYEFGFFEKDGQLFYINSGDDRMKRSDGQLDIMYRTAKHRKDWQGGVNQWNFLTALNSAGFKVTMCSVKL